MVSILLLILKTILFGFVIATIVGVCAFWVDIRTFRSEKEMSLPRQKLIENLIAERELESEKAENESEKWENESEKGGNE